MRISPRWHIATLVIALGASAPLEAQYYAPATLARSSIVGVEESAQRDESRHAAVAPARGRVSHDVLVGAAIGAGVGLVAAAIAASGPGVTDHSEDGMLYVGSAALGAGLGMAIGLIVGLSRD